jgi:dihydrofolate synthase/folylpolyglutamate synthase
MEYEEAVRWLYGTQLHGIHLGLDNVRRLMVASGLDVERPTGPARIFHVAGTNGKGSVCSLLEAGLRAVGMRTGLYTSPHLVRFRERIRVNGEEVDESFVARGLTELRRISEGFDVPPTFFELATVLAFRHFAEAAVDAVVLETGMGGRLDATNVVRPDAAVVTRIGLDHMAYLGGTLGEIAREKAGIFKAGVPAFTVVQEEDAGVVLGAVAAGVGGELEVVVPSFFPEGWQLGLVGRHQRENAALALRVLQCVLGETAQPVLLEQAFSGARWPGRFDEVAPGVILDGAHNPAAGRVLAEAWIERYGPRSAEAYVGMMADKDCEGFLEAIAPALSEIVAVTAPGKRGMDGAELGRRASRTLRRRGVPVRVSERGGTALWEGMVARGVAGGRVLVTGSLHWVGEVVGWSRGLVMETSLQ